MKYFLSGVFLLCVVILSIAGFRGASTQRPPFEIFPDMDRQAKLLPQEKNRFYADSRSSRKPVSGTISRSEPFEDTPVNTGRVKGGTNFVETIPVAVTPELLKKGRQQYGIYCAVCHGATGDGNGITTQYGMTVVANFHDYQTRKMVRAPAGSIFNTISNGKGLMGAYAPKLSISNRWAVVAYVRALQRSRLATIEDVPQSERDNLE